LAHRYFGKFLPPKDMQHNRVLILTADPSTRETLETLLTETGYRVIGSAAGGEQAAVGIGSLEPDVILWDVQDEAQMAQDRGSIQRLLRRHSAAIVALGTEKALRSVQGIGPPGAMGTLAKPLRGSDLQQAIERTVGRFLETASLQRHMAELEALHRASLHLTSRLELEGVLQALLEQVLNLVDAFDTHIFFYDGVTLSLAAALWADGTHGIPFAEPRPEGLTRTVARSGQPVIVPDVNQHPLFEDWQWGGAIIGLPLCVGDQVIGVMNVAFGEPHPFEPHELWLLEALAAQAALAIHNAQLFERVRHRAAEMESQVEEQTRQLTEVNARFRELDHLKSKFISDISRELRAPATNVRLYLDLLERGGAEKRTQYLQVIKAQTDQMIRLVEEILDFADLELDAADCQTSLIDSALDSGLKHGTP
jgi:GAF domain-containing protein